jgi:hypothetical protein
MQLLMAVGAMLILSTITPNGIEAAATITVVNLDGADEGFNDPSDPDADSTNGGNAGTTLGGQRFIAFQFAADIWGGILDSNVEIRVGANFDPLDCIEDPPGTFQITLGQAGPKNAFSFSGGTGVKLNTWYPVALVNKLLGMDADSDNDDIVATFNSSLGTTCEAPTAWYYGLDANPPAGTIDFVTVILHELAHGLGFLTFVDLATGAKLEGLDDIYMTFLENHSTAELYPDMDDAGRIAASINTGNLHWVGPRVIANGVGLTSGRVLPSGHVKMYAPNPAEPGSSVSHFSDTLSPDELMEPEFTTVNHNVGLAESLLKELGWEETGTPVDVYFVVDLSASFADDLPVFQSEAPTIINDLVTAGNDLKVGLGSFEDYPISPFGTASAGDVAYRQNVDLTSDTGAVLTVINGLETRDGNDNPESQLAALFQAATGDGQDLSGVGFPGATIPANQQANFRDGAVKLFLLWTDAPFHRPGDPGDFIDYPGPSFDDTVAAVLALDPAKVIGVSSGADPETLADLEAIAAATGALAPIGGTDCDGDGVTDIPEGEPLVCTTAITGEGVGAAMEAVIMAAVEPPMVVDSDNDGVPDNEDICPGGDDNIDTDTDGVPDFCDQCEGDDATGDTDGDLLCDELDVCPLDPENDADNDGICESDDNCPDAFNPGQDNQDGDEEGDVCDDDIDGDGVLNPADNCPFDVNTDQTDIDGDGVGIVCDDDIDSTLVECLNMLAALNCADVPRRDTDTCNQAQVDFCQPFFSDEPPPPMPPRR